MSKGNRTPCPIPPNNDTVLYLGSDRIQTTCKMGNYKARDALKVGSESGVVPSTAMPNTNAELNFIVSHL